MDSATHTPAMVPKQEILIPRGHSQAKMAWVVEENAHKGDIHMPFLSGWPFLPELPRRHRMRRSRAIPWPILLFDQAIRLRGLEKNARHRPRPPEPSLRFFVVH